MTSDVEPARIAPPLLVMKITGGVGNQLFQYALGRTLSLRLGADLALDAGDTEPPGRSYKGPVRRYGLDRFDIRARMATEAEIARLRGDAPLLTRLLARLLRRRSEPPATWIHERHLWTFDPSVLPQRGDAYLEGWWQSEDYFNEQEDLLRRELVLRRPLAPADAALAERMRAEESVSVHVRRGDYVTDEGSRRFYGEFSQRWLDSAVAELASRTTVSSFFLFSDDPAWITANVRVPKAVEVVSDGRRDQTDELVLMSTCRHHIVPNSSYSWWGAWLGRTSGGLTVGPRLWNLAGVPTPGIVPRWWITV